MSRQWSGDDPMPEGLWYGALTRAIRGKRGQAALRELRDALDAMPEKRLLRGGLYRVGEVCAIGQWVRYRFQRAPLPIDGFASWADLVAWLDRYPDDDGTAGSASESRELAQALGAPYTLAWEIGSTNDGLEYRTNARGGIEWPCAADEPGAVRAGYDGPYVRKIPLTPEERWQQMRDWVEKRIAPEGAAA